MGDVLGPAIVGLERALMIHTKTLDRLTKELVEAKKKLDDKSVTSDKKTFLKAQMPKLEAEIKIEKDEVLGLLEEDELDPRGEFYLMAKKLTKAK